MTIALRTASRLGFTLALLAFVATGVVAQGADAGRGRQKGAELQKRFAAADVNGDGKLTKDEAKTGMPFVYQHFDEIDSAKTGSVTMKDIVVFVRAQGAARKAAP